MTAFNINEDDNLANRTEVKNRKLHVEKKDVKDKVLKKHKPKDLSREAILKKARSKAHRSTANAKRNLSNDMRKAIQESMNIFETFDFIEESYGYGDVLKFQMYEEPVENKSISEALCIDHSYFDPKYLTIGMAEGVFAPIGVMSRNNRIYDEDHYPHLLADENLMNKVHSRAMLGTIGHHDKRVDDEDLANDLCSHVVTDLEVREDEEGHPYLYGRLEILNTTAGRRLRQLYEHGIPLYVSSRGGGKLLNVPNETYKRVDKNNYFLETFDIVKEPGFLEARPVPSVGLVDESIENKDNGEIVMGKELQKDAPITEEKSVVVDESKLEEGKEAEKAPEPKEEEKGKEEKVEEAKEEKEEKEEDKDDKKEKCDESSEVSEEAAPKAEEPKKETEDDEHEEHEGDIAKDGVHEGKEEEHGDDCDCDDCRKERELHRDDEKKCEEKKCHEEDASSEKAIEMVEDIVKDVCEGVKEDKRKLIDEIGGILKDKVDNEIIRTIIKKAEKLAYEESEAGRKVDEDFKAKYEALEPVIEELISMIKDASANLQTLKEENEASKAKLAELSEKLSVSEGKDLHQDPDDDTEVDGPDDEDDEPDDMHEGKEDKEACHKEKDEEEKVEDKEKEEDKDDKKEKCDESSEITEAKSEAEKLGEQIAESADVATIDEGLSKPEHKAPEVFSVFKKADNFKPSKYFSRFNK